MILKCYEILPGQINGPNYIIYGIKTLWSNNIEINQDYVSKGICGEYEDYNNLSKAFKLYNKRQGAPVQLTIIFNILVLYILFNQLNCKVVDDSFKIFGKNKNNKLFLFFESFEFVAQFIIIEYGI